MRQLSTYRHSPLRLMTCIPITHMEERVPVGGPLTSIHIMGHVYPTHTLSLANKKYGCLIKCTEFTRLP